MLLALRRRNQLRFYYYFFSNINYYHSYILSAYEIPMFSFLYRIKGALAFKRLQYLLNRSVRKNPEQQPKRSFFAPNICIFLCPYYNLNDVFLIIRYNKE